MSTILARCAAIGIVAGGFAVTGDLGRLAERGLKVLHASDVPVARSTDDTAAAAPEATLAPSSPPTVAPTVSPVMPPPQAISDSPSSRPTPATASPPAAAHDPAPVANTLDFRPAAAGLEQADIAALGPGERLVVWLTVARRAGNPAYRCLVFDMVDPAAAEALVYEAVSFTADGHPRATATPPRRVRIVGGGDGHIVAKGAAIRIQHLGIAQGNGGDHGKAGEVVGPIVSLDVIR
jgi:hypothetical protein